MTEKEHVANVDHKGKIQFHNKIHNLVFIQHESSHTYSRKYVMKTDSTVIFTNLLTYRFRQLESTSNTISLYYF